MRMLQLARDRGLTYVAITDHDTIEGALRARDAGLRGGVTLIVGQEMRTTEGDMIALFIERPIPSRRTPEEAVALVREQGGLVGLAHPFDVYRPSIGRGAIATEQFERLASLADYVEIHNGRVEDQRANARAADLARERGLPGVAVSDAHTEREVGLVATVVEGPIEGPAELLAALRRGTVLTVREPDEEAAGLLDRLRGRLSRL